jgi:6-phosphofructokinase 1
MSEKLKLDGLDIRLHSVLKSVPPFQRLDESEIRYLASISNRTKYETNEYVFQEGEMGTTLYVVEEGTCCLEIMGRAIKILNKGELFGEIAAIDELPRTATVRTTTPTVLLSLKARDLEKLEESSPASFMKIYKELAKQITSYVRHADALYSDMDTLLVQEGGCAPGYNSVTGYLTRYFETAGRRVFIAREGFKSLVSGTSEDFCCLINDKNLYNKLEQLPGVIFAPPLREARGASFRAERFKNFVKSENQRLAAHHVVARNVKVLIGIGGNGTFYGMNALSKLLPESIQVFFIPVTIDSDIYGTDCIGEHTGVHVGSEKILSYMADARTHHRIYIIEMMGSEGGYHALHSCLGAGADLAVLPSSRHDPKKVAQALKKKECAVIVVAEGYKRAERNEEGFKGNAAEYFRDELLKVGLESNRRIVCEGFSRDIRGAAPNYRDITLSQRMARKLASLVNEGKTRVMPAILANREYDIPFDEIRTDNSVESGLAELANRLVIT